MRRLRGSGVFRALQLYGVRPASLWRHEVDDRPAEHGSPADDWTEATQPPAVAPSAASLYGRVLATRDDSDVLETVADIRGSRRR